MALVMAQEVPTSSSMAVPHGPAGVGQARRRMRDQLRVSGVCDTAVDDAVLILSELLTNACRHGRPLPPTGPGGTATPDSDGDVLAAWRMDTAGRLTVEVTDGGGPTRPVPAKPSVTARGGRGLSIISALADDWGVRDGIQGGVTVWVVVRLEATSDGPTAPRTASGLKGFNGSGGQRQAGGLAASGTGIGGSESAARSAATVAGGGNAGHPHGHRAASSSPLHPHRSVHGQSHRLGAERAGRLASRPMSAFQDRDYPVSFDERD